jgi:alkylation response protein AidB-like acyl-CoA dehydrogenase
MKELAQIRIPIPGRGETATRHKILYEVGREDLSLARLAEAHWDAVAILAEAGREPDPDVLYGVWAAEIPGKQMSYKGGGDGFTISGLKPFCSGAGIVDRALVTVALPEHRLIDLDLRQTGESVSFDDSSWKTTAFAETKTATATFCNAEISKDDFVGGVGWYLSRPGFWHGACGPAACWAGGAAGLLDWALLQTRNDPHTRAHLGAIASSVWAVSSFLEKAGHEIDENPNNVLAAHVRALTLRHLIEQAGTDVLQRVPRAYGPYPLAMSDEVVTRHQELNLYLRQSHAERDLENLGSLIRTSLTDQ